MAIAKTLKLLGYWKAVGDECPQSESSVRFDGYGSVLMREYGPGIARANLVADTAEVRALLSEPNAH